MRLFNLAILFLFVLFVSPVFADDATEAAATNNIIFEKTPELVMEKEILTIKRFPGNRFGEEKFSIDVDFHFKNKSNHDVTRKIAFVFPPVVCREEMNSMWGGLDNTDSANQQNTGLKDFTGTVDGKTIVFTKRVEAMLGGKRITDLLTKLGIPLNPCLIHMTNEGKPDPRFSADLEKYQLLTPNNEPAWSENIYFEWEQVFPAGKVINIHHHYTPVIGLSVPSPRTLADLNDMFLKNVPAFSPIWNRSPDLLAKSNPYIVNHNKQLYPNENQLRLCLIPEWVRYRLTTGAYWNGGIGLFKLIINDVEGAPFAVNKFYKNSDQVKTSLSGNNMTFLIKNFIPTKDLLVLFLSIPSTEENLQSCPNN